MTPAAHRGKRNPFEPFLERADGVVVFDGAMATELERRGADLSDQLWSARLLLDDPEAIIAVSLDYLRAGADVVSTASYQASREGFARRGLSAEQSDALLAKSVTLAREACTRFAREQACVPPPIVAASLGPYGAVLADGSEYRGDYALTVDELVAFHRPRVEAVLRERPDLVLFETLPSLREGEAVARLARAFPRVAFMASFSAVNAAGIAHGEPFSEVVRVLDAEPNVIAVGINCAPPEIIARLISSAGPHRVPLAASPNSGEGWDAVARRWTPASGARRGLGAFAREYFEAGARVLGGCCRTRPADIAELRAALR